MPREDPPALPMGIDSRGHFPAGKHEAAPPWGSGWFNTPTTTVDWRTAPAAHQAESDGVKTGSDGQPCQQKKKLFVGMAPKTAYEDDYKIVFAPFGKLVDIYVIRDRNGFSKGCAFVKYDSVESAQDAIHALHDKYVMPGGFRTLVVTIADDRRGPHQVYHNSDATSAGLQNGCRVTSAARVQGSKGGDSADITYRQGHLKQSGKATSSLQAPYAIPPAAMPPSLLPGVQYVFCGGTPTQGTYVYYPHMQVSCAQNPVAASLPGNGNHPLTLCQTSGSASIPYELWANSPCGTKDSMPQLVDSFRRTHLHGTEVPREANAVSPEEEGRRWAKQTVGPAGANLFVYYLPGSLSDADLATAFAPFGKVLSAKVYYDRETGESKGFGFVSYADPEEAEAAIAGMNGFFIGHKRLKVVRKRGQMHRQESVSSGDSGHLGACCTVGDKQAEVDTGVGVNIGGGVGLVEEGGYHPLFGPKLEREVRKASPDVLDQQTGRIPS